MDKPQVLICAPADGGPHTSDSITVTATCGHEVYVAGAGQRVMKEHPDVDLKCVVCALPEITDGIAGRVRMEGVPGMLEDIDREFGEVDRAETEVIANMLGIKTHG